MSQMPPSEPSRPAPPPSSVNEGVATVVPYRNLPALIAYYLGLFSLFPCVGAVLGIAAVVLGIMGLRKVARQPEVKGAVHAWIGVICGGVFGLIWLLVDTLTIIAIIGSSAGK